MYLHRCVHLHFIVAFSDQMAMADLNLVSALLRQSRFIFLPVLEHVSPPLQTPPRLRPRPLSFHHTISAPSPVAECVTAAARAGGLLNWKVGVGIL